MRPTPSLHQHKPSLSRWGLLLLAACWAACGRAPEPDLEAFGEPHALPVHVSHHVPEEKPYAPFLAKMQPLDSASCRALGSDRDGCVAAFRFDIGKRGWQGLVYGRMHDYGWWDFYLVTYHPDHGRGPGKPLYVAGSEGDAGEGAYTDAWIEDADADGVPEVVVRWCTLLWPEAEGFSRESLWVDVPMRFVLKDGEYVEGPTPRHPERYRMRVIADWEKALREAGVE